jgi:hypothetical protein
MRRQMDHSVGADVAKRPVTGIQVEDVLHQERWFPLRRRPMVLSEAQVVDDEDLLVAFQKAVHHGRADESAAARYQILAHLLTR